MKRGYRPWDISNRRPAPGDWGKGLRAGYHDIDLVELTNNNRRSFRLARGMAMMQREWDR